MKFAKAELKEFKTSEVCRLLGVSRSEYYKEPKQTENEIKEIEQAIIHCFNKSDGSYGRIRIRKYLEKQNITVGEYKISRILNKYGLKAKGGRPKKARNPKPTDKQYIEENLIKNKFEVSIPNYLWCSDISEFMCKGSKLYVCGVIDVSTRRIVGWSISRNQTQKIVHDALKMAIGRNPKRPKEAVFHSDRGSQYTSKKTKELIEQYGFRKSMSRPGTPSDNQPIESFWNTLKREMPDIRHLPFDEASRVIVNYIELFYNSERLHSSINYMSPNQFFTLRSVHST